MPLNPDGATTSKGLYARYCAGCHGIELEGDPEGDMPPLTQIDLRMNRDEVQEKIRQGIGFMPSFGFLSEREISAITNLLFHDIDPDQNNSAQILNHELSSSFAGSPYAHTGYNRFLDQDDYPAVKPPWGTLNAINLNAGTIEWSVPLGEFSERGCFKSR